jgi:Trypsin-like peptidase domain
MFEPKSIAEKLVHSTVRISAETSNGTSRGTGFFYNFPLNEEGKVVPTIVTNKHVIGDSKKQNFLINLHDPGKGEKFPTSNLSVELTEGSAGNPWVQHPDPNVDLCCLPIAQIQEAIPSPLKPFYIALDGVPSDLDLSNLDAIEDVIMIGYPNGLWDHVNNLPLVRKGTTATHPGIAYQVEGQAGPGVTVVDMACFPGSSGSPVFVYTNGAINDKSQNVTFGTRVVFIGVLFSGPVMRDTGEVIVKKIPTKTVSIAELRLMINLGYVIKPKEIVVLGKEMYSKRGMSYPT